MKVVTLRALHRKLLMAVFSTVQQAVQTHLGAAATRKFVAFVSQSRYAIAPVAER